MKSILFDNWHTWKVCFLSGCRKFIWGFCRIITCLIFGIVSIFVYIGKQIEAFCRREFIASLIVGIFAVIVVAGWMGTFVTERSARVTAEYQRDSLAMKLDSAKQYSRNPDYRTSGMLIRNNVKGNE